MSIGNIKLFIIHKLTIKNKHGKQCANFLLFIVHTKQLTQVITQRRGRNIF